MFILLKVIVLVLAVHVADDMKTQFIIIEHEETDVMENEEGNEMQKSKFKDEEVIEVSRILYVEVERPAVEGEREEEDTVKLN